MHIARVRAWLCWHISDSVAANDVSAEEVSTRESENELGPPRDVHSSVCEFKWEVPNDSSICLGCLVGMLTGSRLVSRNLFPVHAISKTKLTADTVSIVERTRLDMARNHKFEACEWKVALVARI